MQLLVWIGLCAVLSFVLSRRPVALVGVVLALRIAIPNVAASLFTGQETVVQLQPSSYFLVFAFIFAVLANPRSFNEEVGRHIAFYLPLLLVFTLATAVTANVRGPQSVVLLVDTFGMGLLILLMIRAAMVDDADRGRKIAVVFVAIAVAESAVALTQWITQDTLIWKNYMSTYYWYDPVGTTVTGTVGAWLDIGMMLAVAVPLAAGIKRAPLRFSAVIVLILGIMATERRTPLVVAVIGLVYLLFVSTMSKGVRVVSFIGVGVTAWLVLASNLIAGVTERFETDVISGQVRGQALEFFLTNIGSQPWYGGGFGANGGASEGLASSFENGYIMYAWDIGLISAAVFFGALVVHLLITLARGPVVPGAIVALAFALVLVGTYSGMQTQGPGSWILFFAAGVCAAKARKQGQLSVARAGEGGMNDVR